MLPLGKSTEWAPAGPFVDRQNNLSEWDQKKYAHITTFSWGAACTVHRSQGSQWRHVHVLADWERFYYGLVHGRGDDPAKAMREVRRLLYTAVTRAQELVTYGGGDPVTPKKRKGALLHA